jgi:hypothetical protein
MTWHRTRTGRAVPGRASPSGSTPVARPHPQRNLHPWSTSSLVVGVTTNPTNIAAAISGSESYDDQLHAMAVRK